MTLRKQSEEVTHDLVMTSPPLPADYFTRLSGFVTEICWETENRWPFALSEITSTRNRRSLRTSGRMFLRNSGWNEADVYFQSVAHHMISERNAGEKCFQCPEISI